MLGCLSWLGVTAFLTCTATSPVMFKTGMSAGYRKWLSHRLRLTQSSNAIQQCDNQISANKSWFAAQLKSGSSCFWKGLFDNVIELYQQEIMHGNINNHKVIIFSSPTLHQWMLEASGWAEKKPVIWCCRLQAPSHSSRSLSLQDAWLHPQTVPSPPQALLSVLNADIHGKVCGTQTSKQQQRARCDVWPIKRPHFLSDFRVGLVA